MGAGKSLKTSKKSANSPPWSPLEPENRDERCPKALVNKGPREQRQTQNQMADGRWQMAVERYKKSPS